MCNEVKPWLCEGGHVMGQVMRNGSKTRRLLIYREAVDPTAEAPGEVDVIAVAEGTIFDVRCSICGRTRTWVMGQEGLKDLLERVGR